MVGFIPNEISNNIGRYSYSNVLFCNFSARGCRLVRPSDNHPVSSNSLNSMISFNDSLTDPNWRQLLYRLIRHKHSCFYYVCNKHPFAMKQLVVPCCRILVPRDKPQRISVGDCSMAVWTFIEASKGKHPTRFWGWYHARVLVGNLHFYQWNFVGTARTFSHENEVWNLGNISRKNQAKQPNPNTFASSWKQISPDE